MKKLFGIVAITGLLFTGCASGNNETADEPEPEPSANEEVVDTEEQRKQEAIDGYVAAMFETADEQMSEEDAAMYKEDHEEMMRCIVDSSYDDLSDETIDAFIDENVDTLKEDEAAVLFEASADCMPEDGLSSSMSSNATMDSEGVTVESEYTRTE